MSQSEAEFLNQYNPHDFDAPLVTVDQCIFTLREGDLHVLLVQRAGHPFKGRWGLPGGFVDTEADADLTATACRKLVAKTGVATPYLEQVCSLGGPSRDPRGWSVTVLFMALVRYQRTAEFIATVADARWWPVTAASELKLAFDHNLLLRKARKRLRDKTAYTLLPMHIIDAPFTLTQLQQAFETLLDKSLEKKSFRRRMLNADVLEEAGEGATEGGRGRPAALFRPRKGSETHQFVRVFGEM